MVEVFIKRAAVHLNVKNPEMKRIFTEAEVYFQLRSWFYSEYFELGKTQQEQNHNVSQTVPYNQLKPS